MQKVFIFHSFNEMDLVKSVVIVITNRKQYFFNKNQRKEIKKLENVYKF